MAEETAEWAEQQRQMSRLDASADALQAEEKERRALISADRKRREAEAEQQRKRIVEGGRFFERFQGEHMTGS